MSDDERQWYLQAADGAEKGPYSADALVQSYAEKLITRKSLLRFHPQSDASATADWKPLDQHPDLMARIFPTSSKPRTIAEPQGDCPICGNFLVDEGKRTFLGFHKFKCTRCPNIELYPLSTAYRVIYLLIVGLSVLFIVVPFILYGGPTEGGRGVSPDELAFIAGQQFGRTSVFFIPAAFALLKDRRLRTKSLPR